MKIGWSKVVHKNEMYITRSVLLFMSLAGLGEKMQKMQLTRQNRYALFPNFILHLVDIL